MGVKPMRRTTLFIAMLAVLNLTLGACTQVDRAVRGFQVPPGGWAKLGEGRTVADSQVIYLGASADGAIIVRMPSGESQVWRSACR